MRDTVWNGNVQRMVLDDGRPKGMKIVLKESGVDTHGMNAEKMREKLNTYEDFKIQKTILEEYVEQRGHLCLYYPTYHCELSPLESLVPFQKAHVTRVPKSMQPQQTMHIHECQYTKIYTAI